MSRVTRKEWYERVNAAWPNDLPPLSGGEAIRAACKLYRFATGRTWYGEVRETGGRRYTDIRRGVIYVNPAGNDPRNPGWRGLVHELSHSVLYAPHGGEHARLELRMIKEVLKRGWLDGRLKDKERPEPTKEDAKWERLRRLYVRRDAWETKKRRAERALAKLGKQIRRLDKEVGSTGATVQ